MSEEQNAQTTEAPEVATVGLSADQTRREHVRAALEAVEGTDDGGGASPDEAAAQEATSEAVSAPIEDGVEDPASETEIDPSAMQQEYERRETKLREWEQSLKKQNEEATQFQALLELKKTDPLAFLQQSGVDVEDIIHRVVNENNPSPESVKKQEDQKFEQLQSKIDKLEKYIQDKENTSALQSYKSRAAEVVASEQYSWLNDYCDLVGSTPGDLAENVLASYYNEHGQTLTPKQAIDIISKEIKPRWDKSRGGSPQATSDQPGTISNPVETKGPKTLSNNMTPAAPADLSNMSWNEKKAALAKKIMFRDEE